MSRQLQKAIMIDKKGVLNKKNEFGINEIIRLDAPSYSWDRAEQETLLRKQKCEHGMKMNKFVSLMSNVSKS